MSKTEVYKLNSDTNKGFSCASVFQRHLGRAERRKMSLTQYLEALQCAACTLHHHAMSWYPGRQTDNSDTYSTDVAFDLVQHCYRGQEAERLLGSPLWCSHLEPGALGTAGQTSAMAQEPRHSERIQSAAHTPRVFFDTAACLLAALYPLQGSQIKQL